MKKLNNSGFILAETLVVTVFLMIIFTLLYTNYYPLIGEYNKREVYDDIDGKYTAYWIKKLIEDGTYIPPTAKKEMLENVGFMRFDCDDVDGKEAQDICAEMVRNLEIACETRAKNCEMFITYYRIGGVTPEFKEVVRDNLKKYQEPYYVQIKKGTMSDSTARGKYIEECKKGMNSTLGFTRVCQGLEDKECNEVCNRTANENVFTSGMQDYVETLPQFTTPSLNYAKFRVIISVHHKKDNNNYYSYSTIEVDK